MTNMTLADAAAEIRRIVAILDDPTQSVTMRDRDRLLAAGEAVAQKAIRFHKVQEFAVNVMGGPMREFAPSKWENAVWPSDGKAEPAGWQYRITDEATGYVQPWTHWSPEGRDDPFPERIGRWKAEYRPLYLSP